MSIYFLWREDEVPPQHTSAIKAGKFIDEIKDLKGKLKELKIHSQEVDDLVTSGCRIGISSCGKNYGCIIIQNPLYSYAHIACVPIDDIGDLQEEIYG